MNKVYLRLLGFLGFKKINDNERKSAAEWGFLLSTLFIFPLFFLPDASEIIKIGLQLLWGLCVARSAFMANDTWKKNNSR
ncbi:hypothetical protein JK229_21565 [Pantoea dispersa]|uniref:hypothetical protein n=1 Tax=Pantoea dispersa TaxID=59814 RepID=UPI001BAD0F91|nr:hypothetical protein [Pantoea dispersa]MBS0899973.1 hypothetical protein [Pantoea dispersa]MBS0907691.1 hypothetical protein [Pantoea dispersa]